MKLSQKICLVSKESLQIKKRGGGGALLQVRVVFFFCSKMWELPFTMQDGEMVLWETNLMLKI